MAFSIFDNYTEACVRIFDTQNTFYHFGGGQGFLNAQVVGAGYEDCRDARYDWHGLKRGNSDLVIIQHTLSGSGHLEVNNQTFSVEEGQTMLLRIPQNSRYWLGDNDHWEFFWLTLSGTEVIRLFDSCIMGRGPLQIFERSVIDKLALLTHEILTETSPSAGHLSSRSYEVTMLLFDAVMNAGKDTEKDSVAVNELISYIEHHLDEPLSVSGLAEKANYSRAYFTQMFTEVCGEPPGSYILKRRLAKSMDMLKFTRHNVKYISESCGFTDPNYFAKCFRRHFNQSPRDFRKSII